VQMPKGGLVGALAALLGPPGGGFGVARAVKWREVVQPERTKEWMLREAADPALKMVLTGHWEPVLHDAAALLVQAATKGL